MKKIVLLCFSFAFVLSAWAQERMITGKVSSSEDGSPLPGVNVVVKGTTNGTVTDVDGKYTLSVPASGGNLVFSFIGLATQEVAVGERSVIDIGLSLDVKQLSEVVVTAQGIERNQKALGYAQTTISSQLLANKPETDIGRALQGRSPGIQILNSSGLAGSSSRINIRGNSSITGDTQPLWVVNGVPINTSSNDINSNFQDGNVAPARYLDIDPNNIESISILRGLQATTTYGSQGRNGVILVTTKTGSKNTTGNKFQGSVTQSYFAVQAVIPEYQNKWTNGFDGAYGEFFSNWGALFDGKAQPGSPHPYSEWRNIFPNHPEFQQTGSIVEPGQTVAGYVPVAQPNNVKDFFKTGSSATTSLSLGASNEFGSVNFSYSHLDESGFVINNKLKRDNFGFGATAKLTKKFTLTANMNFARTDQQTPPSGAALGSNSAGGPSIFAEVFFTPRNIDLTNWPHENPVDHSSTYYRNNNGISNVYWLANNTLQTNTTNRFFSSQSLNYKFTDWFNLTYRLGFDTYSEHQTYQINKGSGPSFDSNLTPGAYRTTTGTSTVIDHSVLANFNKDLSQDLNLTGVVGGNYRQNNYLQEGLESLGQVVYGLFEHRNFTSTQAKDFRGSNLNYKRNSTIAGLYFDANLGYKQMLYVSLSGRNDWSSTLQPQNRSKFYPGGSVAFIPTAAFPNFGAGVLDFLKIRAAYGTSANFGTPYNTVPYLALNSQNRVDAIGNVVTSRLSSQLANPNLLPELLTETEVGLEGQMFENKIKFNLSYYNRVAKNQIISRPLDTSTGYSSTYINAGTISNKGFELSMTVTPIKTSTLQWDITANWTKNVSKVDQLPAGSTQILVNGYTNLGNFAIQGQPINVIQGSYTSRAPDGQLIINSSGNYQIANDIGIIANPNPNYMLSGITNLSWKAISFGMQWDFVQGGQTLSYTAQTMVGRGVSKDLQSFDPTLPLILPGVNEVKDASGNVTGYKPNSIPLTTAGVFFGNTIIGGGPYDRGIYDATRVRFREVSLTYALPKSFVSKMKLTGVNLSLVGNNLWWRAINAPLYSRADFDRTAYGTGNGAGFDYMGGPSARRFGGTIKITF